MTTQNPASPALPLALVMEDIVQPARLLTFTKLAEDWPHDSNTVLGTWLHDGQTGMPDLARALINLVERSDQTSYGRERLLPDSLKLEAFSGKFSTEVGSGARRYEYRIDLEVLSTTPALMVHGHQAWANWQLREDPFHSGVPKGGHPSVYTQTSDVFERVVTHGAVICQHCGRDESEWAQPCMTAG